MNKNNDISKIFKLIFENQIQNPNTLIENMSEDILNEITYFENKVLSLINLKESQRILTFIICNTEKDSKPALKYSIDNNTSEYSYYYNKTVTKPNISSNVNKIKTINYKSSLFVYPDELPLIVMNFYFKNSYFGDTNFPILEKIVI